MDSLTSLIRSMPACFDGQAAADFTASVARQVIDQAPGLDTASSWFDFGEGTKVYSTERIVSAANELKLYGESLRQKGGKFCTASEERNRIITLLGNVDGLVGARVAVNATLVAAQEQLGKDIVDNAKAALDYGKYFAIGAAALVAIYFIARLR